MKKVLLIFTIFAVWLFIFPQKLSAQVVINEFLVDGSPEWVELKNASDSAEYLKNYYIDDDENFTSDTGSSGKKSLVNLEISNVAYPYFELPSPIFNNTGIDWVVLFDGGGNVVDSYSYEKNPGENISMGRSPDGIGDFYILQSTTKSSANSAPVPNPTSAPTLTPTPTPTLVSTPSPTLSPVSTKTPTPMPKKTPSPKPINTPEEVVLGENTVFPSPTAKEPVLNLTEKPKGKIPLLAIGLVILGMGFIGFSVFTIIKNAKKSYTIESGKEDGQIF